MSKKYIKYRTIKCFFCFSFLLMLILSTLIGCSKKDEGGNDFTTSEYSGEVVKAANTETVKNYPDSGLYDELLASGDGYFLVSKYEEDYNYASMKFGVLDEKNNWVLPLSENNVFGTGYKEVSKKTTVNSGETGDLSYKYMGQGVFIGTAGVDIKNPDGTSEHLGKYGPAGNEGLSVYCYNAKNNSEFEFRAVHITPYANGYMLMYNSQRYNSPFYSIDDKGKVSELPVEYGCNDYNSTFPAYSDGLFYSNGYFYNISGEIMINLTDLDLTNTDLYFNDGKCKLTFKNPGGTMYKATIDKNGNFIEKPQPLG